MGRSRNRRRSLEDIRRGCQGNEAQSRRRLVRARDQVYSKRGRSTIRRFAMCLAAVHESFVTSSPELAPGSLHNSYGQFRALNGRVCHRTTRRMYVRRHHRNAEPSPEESRRVCHRKSKAPYRGEIHRRNRFAASEHVESTAKDPATAWADRVASSERDDTDRP